MYCIVKQKPLYYGKTRTIVLYSKTKPMYCIVKQNHCII